MTSKLLSLTVKGKNKTWSFNFSGDPKYLADWRADGLQVDEVVGSIPVWVVELGLTKLWFRLQDIFNFRNPWRGDMTESLEQIISRVAEEWGFGFDESGLVRIPQGFHLATYVKEVVAELTKGQEPVAWMDGFGFPHHKSWLRPIRASSTPLYAAPIPATCPVCTQAIDDAAKAGRIVDERWQPTDEELTAIYMQANGIEGKKPPITTERIFTAMRAMLAAAPEYRK